ncbi:MAG: two-component system response regulator [Chloroflexi bacterium HGW-Chloroflexi-9]|nr:MAG: two-component system response regulator [Chloroflexi bacterium HGW-Chloroflexi-9]
MATILIADDAAFMRMKIAALIKGLGHTVVEASDGVEAVARYREQRPDAVLLDITMPNMDGLEALKEIMAGDPTARVAMVTAMGQKQVVMEAIKTGAKDFVVKPFNAELIETALQRLVIGAR